MVVPAPVATAFPPLKRRKTGQQCPINRRESDGGDEPLVLHGEPGDHHGNETLEHVASERENGGPLPSGPQHVRRTYVPAAYLPDVHAEGPPDQVPGRHGAENIAEQHEKNP